MSVYELVAETKQFVEPTDIQHFVPTVFIGVGGTGKEALMRLRKRFYDDGRELRQYTRYLIIDTDSRWVPEKSAESVYLPVQPEPDEKVVCPITEAQFLETFNRLERQHDPLFVSWLNPDMRNKGAGAVQHGAGTHRQFGRLAFMLNYDSIRSKIKSQIDDVSREAAEAAHHAAGKGTVNPKMLEVVIVTSLAGGTGAGMFLDVAYLVKDILADDDNRGKYSGTNVTLICVLPTAFKAEDSAFKRYQQNAYAALLELEYYGTPRSGEEVFIGREPKRKVNRVIFQAPWENGKEIEGAGWDQCYLIDNVTPLTQALPLPLHETYQMIADYLYLDFQESTFAVKKRSLRCNLRQFQEYSLDNRVHKALAQGQGMRENADVIYSSKNGCTFSCFGLSEITFDSDGVYRAAAYRLASKLVRQRWLAAPELFPESEYVKLAKKDLYEPTPGDPDAPSFRSQAVAQALYQTPEGNWLGNAVEEVKQLPGKPFTKGSVELRAVVEKHSGYLKGGGGMAEKSLAEREKELRGKAGRLGIYQQRLRNLARQRADAHGASVAKEFLRYYFEILKSVVKTAAEGGGAAKSDDNALTIARLAEADSMFPPVRKYTQRVEYQKACGAVKETVVQNYQRAVSGNIRNLMAKAGEYIGSKNNPVPPELNQHGTLYKYLEESERQLRAVAGRLDMRFAECIKDEGTDRRQSLLPADWDADKYEEQIHTALLQVAEFRLGNSIHWDHLNDLVLQKLREAGPQELRGEARTSMDVVDAWFKHKLTGEDDIPRIADDLATACEQVLKSHAPLDLSHYAEGSVIDLLKSMKKPVREAHLERLVKFGAPYLPMTMPAAIGTKHRPTYRNLAGKQAEESPKVREVMAELRKISHDQLQDQGAIHSELAGSPSSLILCMEVWGVPLQYYSYLDSLHKAYTAVGNQSECHLNFRFGEEDLPEIRALNPVVYEKIHGNIENVLFAMIRGDISFRRSIGQYVVLVIDDRVGTSDPKRVGSRLSRVVKRCCEDDRISEHLLKVREEWESHAKAKKWAMIHASTMFTYRYCKTETTGHLKDNSTPLSNCFGLLVDHSRNRLLETDEGRQWLEWLRQDQNGSDGQAGGSFLTPQIRQLMDQKVLFQASEHVPILEVNWKLLDQVELPAGLKAPEPTPAG